MALFLVNRSLDGTAVELRLAEGRFAGPLAVHVVNGPDIKTANTFDAPEQVTTRRSQVTAEGRSVAVELEPHSVTALVGKVSR
ncbi:MAG: hypothetical protein D6790_17230 [Caldilineae bacterium]|nr:MAG: hypothetical protein D6790_17230 [Caldilineae bacterium]